MTGNEMAQAATYNEMMAQIIRLMDDVILALIERGKSWHGEKTVAAAVLAGESTEVTEFLPGSADPKTAGEQQEALSEFKLRLQQAGISFVAVDIGEEGRTGVIFRARDHERVRSITEDMNHAGRKTSRGRDM